MNNMRNKILSLLVLLLTAATGARATDPKVYTEPVAISSLHVGDILATGFSLTLASESDGIYFDANRSKQNNSPMGSQWYVALNNIKSYGENAAITSTNTSDPSSDLTATPVDASGNDGNAWVVTFLGITQGTYTIRLSGTYYDPPIEVNEVNPVTVSGATKQWEFDMPASDVLLTPVYAPTAVFTVENAGTANEKTLLPTAVDGVIAGTDVPIIVEGTVANAGTSTDKQGQVKYFPTTEQLNAAPATSAEGWISTVPTAKDVTGTAKVTEDKTVYVWYYIVGADTPENTDATAENTFNDSDPQCIAVTLKPNVFTLTLQPAPVDKVTVTIGDASATPDQNGKISDVQMGKTVKLAPNTGYKLRKVEVKKTAARVTTPPQANTFTTASNNYDEALVTAGAAEGGTVWYAFTTTKIQPDDANFPFDTPPTLYNLLSFLARTSLPAGTYYVWYKVVGNPGYSDSEVAYVALTVTEAQ